MFTSCSFFKDALCEVAEGAFCSLLSLCQEGVKGCVKCPSIGQNSALPAAASTEACTL